MSEDLDAVEHLLAQRFYAEAAYFAGVASARAPSARAHMLAGAGCCGCAEPLAAAQRLLDGDPDPGEADAGLRISPATELPYEGLEHLLEALRVEPALRAPEALRDVFDRVADDLAYVSRREIHRPPDARRTYSHGLAAVMAALLLRRLTGSDRELPRVSAPTLDAARGALAERLGG